MAFPTVDDTAKSIVSINTTTHTVDLPPNISSGDLLIVWFSRDGGGTTTFPNEGTDWFEISDRSFGQTFGLAVFYRNADGTEGATITVTTSSSQQSSHCAYRITGHDTGRPPDDELSFATGDSVNPDPDNNDQGGGAEDYLWIATEAHDRDRTTDAFPTNYTANQLVQTGGGANGASVAIATRNLNASAEDVGAFTISAVDEWIALTVAVHPLPGDFPPIRPMDQLHPRAPARAAPYAYWIANLLAVPERVFPPIRPMPQLLPLAAPRAAPDSLWIDNLLAVPELVFPPIRPMVQLHPRAAPRAAPAAYQIQNTFGLEEPDNLIRPMLQLLPLAALRGAPNSRWIDNLLAVEEVEFPPIRPMPQLLPLAAPRAAPTAYQIQNTFGLVEPDNLILPMVLLPVMLPARAAPLAYWIQNRLQELVAEDLPPGVQMQVTVYRRRRASPSSYWIQGLIAAQIQPPPVAVGGGRRNQADTMVISVFI